MKVKVCHIIGSYLIRPNIFEFLPHSVQCQMLSDYYPVFVKALRVEIMNPIKLWTFPQFVTFFFDGSPSRIIVTGSNLTNTLVVIYIILYFSLVGVQHFNEMQVLATHFYCTLLSKNI